MASRFAIDSVREFLLENKSPALLVLDSNHSHIRVLNELNTLAPLLPIGSIVIVADPIIAEMPKVYHPDRPWDHEKTHLPWLVSF